jgi:hypothetical protein
MLRSIPQSFRAGDTWKWQTTHADYSAADDWTLTTSFRGPSSLDVVAEAADGAWLTTAAATATDSVEAGNYLWQSRVSKAGEVFTIATGNVTVLQALADVGIGVDVRTSAERQLDLCEAAIESLISKTNASASFGDQSYSLVDIEKLYRIRASLRNEVAALRGNANGGAGRRILVKFSGS